MHHNAHHAGVAALTVFTCLAMPGCHSASDSDEGSPSPSAPASAIAGAGSTFVAPLMSAWIEGYQKAHPKVQVTYRAIGSGGGIDEYKKGWLGFAASDAPLSDEQMKEMPPTIQVPATAGPVCLIYNLPSLQGSLRLSPKSLAGIFLGRIISWQDPQIAADNPGAHLPKAPVIVVHRSDGSGTTNVLTTYLSKVDSEWSSKPGHGLSVNWPVGLAAEGSKGVLNLVRQTPGTIGYLELSYAQGNGLPVAAIRNQAGEFVLPTPDSAATAVAAFEGDLENDVRTPIVDPPATARKAYPISGFTFLLIRKESAVKDEQATVRDFVAYAISTGQDSAERLSYAKLSPSVQQKAQALLAQLAAGSQPSK